MNKSYIRVCSKEDVLLLKNQIDKADLIAIDTETTSLNTRKGSIIGVSISTQIGEGFYIPTIAWNNQLQQLEDLYIDGTKAHDIAKYILRLMPTKKLVAHNASFDFRYIKNYYGIDLIPSLYVDTALLVHTVKEEGAFGFGAPFGLKSIAKMVQKEIGLDLEKEANEEQLDLKESIKRNGGSVTKENYEIYKADSDTLAGYAAADADLTLRICSYFLDRLKEEGLEKFFFEEEVMPLYREVTIPMEEHGIKLDLLLIQKIKKDIAIDLEKYADLVTTELLSNPKVRGWIIDKAIATYPPKNKGTFAQALLEEEGLNLIRSERTGKFTLNKAVVVALPDSNLKTFLLTGDIAFLTKEQIVKTSVGLWKEDNSGTFFNIQSKDQMGQIAFGVLGIEPQSQTTKGKNQFDEDLVESIGDEHTWAKYLRIYNKLTKIRSAYIDRFLNASDDGKFYPYFKQNGTVSGRYGSDIQQLPKPLEPGQDNQIVIDYTNIIRTFFICDDGCKLLDTDYQSLEPRVFASVTGDQGLKDIFSQDLDFYSHIAIKTEKLEGVSAHIKAPNFLKKVDPIKRQTAKTYSLGVPYGMSGYALAMTLGISQKEGTRLVEGYLDGFPDLRKWREASREFVKEHGFIRNKVGRVRHLPIAKEIHKVMNDKLLDWKFRKQLEYNYGVEKVNGLYRDYKNALNNCLNYQIQSFAASVVNRAALQINRTFKQEGIVGQVIAQIHDQLICQVKDVDIKRACEIVQDCMENTTKLEGVELIAEPEVAENFAEGH